MNNKCYYMIDKSKFNVKYKLNNKFKQQNITEMANKCNN